jgi:3,4-dihydroxy 2-butanone 4-phosphate synthase/GTP cyclohydrolase II
MMVFRNTLDRTEHLALVKGQIEPDRPTMVRMHRVDFAADMLGHVEARRDYVPAALNAISRHDGAGVAVFIRDPSPSWLSERYGADAPDQSKTALRDYGVGAQILLDLGVRDMILLSSSPVRLAAAEGYGLRIVDRVPLSPVE